MDIFDRQNGTDDSKQSENPPEDFIDGIRQKLDSLPEEVDKPPSFRGLSLEDFKERTFFPTPTLDEMIEEEEERRRKGTFPKASSESGFVGLSLRDFKEHSFFPEIRSKNK